jgi:hypothetical protein
LDNCFAQVSFYGETWCPEMKIAQCLLFQNKIRDFLFKEDGSYVPK